MDHLDTIPTVTVQALNATFGVLFIGFILAVILYGLTFFRTFDFPCFSKYYTETCARNLRILFAFSE